MRLKVASILFLGFFLVSISTAKPVYLDSGKVKIDEIGSRPSSPSLMATEEYSGKFLMQFKDTSSNELREKLEEKGIIFHEYIPENTWIVTLDSISKSKVSRRKDVRSVKKYLADYKIARDLTSRNGNLTVEVVFFDTYKGNGEILEQYGELGKNTGQDSWNLKTNSESLEEISSLKEVKYVRKGVPSLVTFNDVSRKVIGADTVESNDYNLTGEGFTASVWDQGWAGKHQDLNYSGKLVIGDSGKACGSCSFLDHGTHVAGTLLGGGKKDSNLRGVAQDSRLATFEWPGYDSGVSAEEEVEIELNRSINKYSSVVSHNSWGFSDNSFSGEYVSGDYTLLADIYDSIINKNNPGVSGASSVVFSAGNFRDNSSRDYNTTMPPATAKNIISVGAVDDNGLMTGYSSWGPTDDGRIKPDLVADGGCGSGSSIQSTVTGDTYGFKCGTSMAGPAVSGAVVLTYEQFNRTYDRLPTPATAKGLLIHNAKDLNRTGPDYITGWGLVNITDTADYIKKSKNEDLLKTEKLNSDEKDNYSISLSEKDSFKATLVWSDAKGSSNDKTLVNDLDLVVRNGTGQRFYPWTLNWSIRSQNATRNREDHRNNVEQVYIPEAEPGNYSISVESYKMPQNPQNYTLLLGKNSTDVSKETKFRINDVSPKTGVYQRTPNFKMEIDGNITQGTVEIKDSNHSLGKVNSTLYRNKTISIPEGTFNATFYAEGNSGTTKTDYTEFTFDETSPEADIVSPLPGNYSGPVELSATWSDNYSSVRKAGVNIDVNDSTLRKDLNSTLSSTRLSDGEKLLNFTFEDKAGNPLYISRNITVDNSPPVFKDTSFQDTALVRENISLNISSSDEVTEVRNETYLIENTTYSKSGKTNSSFNTSNLADGSYNLTFTTVDILGNSMDKQVDLEVDNTRPEITLNSPQNNTTVKNNISTDISFSDSNPDRNKLELYNKTGKVLESGNNFYVDDKNITEANYTLKASSTDKAGNINSKNISFSFKTRPQIEIYKPDTYHSESPKFNISSGEIDKVKIGLDGANHSTYNSGSYFINETLTSSEGEKNATLHLFEGETLWERDLDFILDQTPPEFLMESPSEMDNISDMMEVNLENISEISGIRGINITGENSSFSMNESGVLNVSSLDEGRHNLSIDVYDRAGNKKTVNRTVNVDRTPPKLNNTPASNIFINETFKLNASSSDSGVGAAKKGYRLNLDNSIKKGGLNDTLNISSIQDGDYSLEVYTVDYAENYVNHTSDLRIDTKPPVFENHSPTQSKVSTDFRFSTEFSDASGVKVNDTEIKVEKATISEKEIVNETFKARISNANPGSSLKLELKLIDQAGNINTSSFSYTVESDSSGGDSSGGSSFSSPPTTDKTEKENENSTETTTENQSEIKSKDNETTELNLGPNKNKAEIKNDDSSVEEIEVSSSSSTQVTISETEEELEPPKETRKIDNFNISVNESQELHMNLTFRVEKNKINKTSPENVKLYRKNNSEWQKLETDLEEVKNQSYIYKSKIPGFSPFVVATSETNSSNETSIQNRNLGSTNSSEKSLDEKKEEKISDGLYLPLVILTVAIVVFGSLVRKYLQTRKLQKEINEIRSNTDHSPKTRSKLVKSELHVRNGRIKEAIDEIKEIKKQLRREKHSQNRQS